MAQNDILEALSISAGSIVVEVGIAVLTAEDSTCKLDVGDGTTVDGFLDNVDAESAAGSVFNSLNAATGADAYSGGKYYAADDTIDVKFLDGAANTFKGVIWCKFFKTILN